MTRTPPKKKAKELAKLLRAERPDYSYLKSVFRALREELEIEVPRKEARLPQVPTEEEIRRFYQEYEAQAVVLHTDLQLLLTKDLKLTAEDEELLRITYEKSRELQALAKSRPLV